MHTYECINTSFPIPSRHTTPAEYLWGGGCSFGLCIAGTTALFHAWHSAPNSTVPKHSVFSTLLHIYPNLR